MCVCGEDPNDLPDSLTVILSREKWPNVPLPPMPLLHCAGVPDDVHPASPTRSVGFIVYNGGSWGTVS